MNIFNELSNGSGSINEPNISSFLAYLLTPAADHGLNDEFLKRFLKLIKKNDKRCITSDSICNTKIELEEPVKDEGHEYRIDLIFEIQYGGSDYIIAIENKILEKSKREGQLQHEYAGLKNAEKFKNKNIIVCFLTPQGSNEEKLDIKGKDEFHHIKWSNIIKELLDILQKEHKAQINPISDYTKHTIKAFINFMNTFISEDSKSVLFELDNNKYNLIKYKEGKIILEREENIGWTAVTARPLLRQKLYEINPSDYDYSKTESKNTRELGAWLFKILMGNGR